VENRELGARVRRLRAERGLTLKQVEEASGLSATHLSEIERGRTSPTIGALVRVAQALGRTTSYFLEPDELPDVARLPHERTEGFSARGGARVERLTPGVPGNHLFAYRFTLAPAAPTALTLNAQDSPAEALYLVRHGRIGTTFGETRLELEAGDAVQTRLERPHVLSALEGGPAEVIAILTRRIEDLT
jgi:transcriptional regulator with XRE-family HTH domain